MTTSGDDRAALDANYNLRAAVPEFQSYFDRYDQMSAAFRGRRQGRVDLAYGPGPRQAIDLYLPDRAADRPPLAAFIHGGYWHTQDRKRYAFVAEHLLERGAAVALIGYDLAPDVDMDQIVAEIRAALAWLYRNAGTHGFDGGRIFVAGHSAGGHLTAMALATDWAGLGLPGDLIKGVCPISGVFDLEPIRRCYLNDVLALSTEQARRNSPIHLSPRTRCPALIAVGAEETPAFLEQSERYARLLEEAGLACESLVLPGLDHFGIIQSLAEPDSSIVAGIARRMGLGA